MIPSPRVGVKGMSAMWHAILVLSALHVSVNTAKMAVPLELRHGINPRLVAASPVACYDAPSMGSLHLRVSPVSLVGRSSILPVRD